MTDARNDSGTSVHPPPPGALRPNAIPDARFAMNFRDSVPRATEVMMRFFAALTSRDASGIATQLHFPLGSFEGSEPVITEDSREFAERPPASLSMALEPERHTDHDGYLQAGCYDTFAGLEILNCNAVCVNVAMSYNRYDRRGHPLLRCDGVYCVTNNDGVWGIQAMSTIFTPAQALGVPFDDAIARSRRLRFDHCLAYMVEDEKGVWGPIRQYGLNIGVSGGARPGGQRGVIWKESLDGHAMEFFEAAGVKSRLSVEDMTQERLDGLGIPFEGFDDYRALWSKTGLGNFGWVVGGAPPARIIHVSVDKAHVLQGATRFTTSGEFINNSIEVDVVTYRRGRWGLAGIWGYITERDRTNDVDETRSSST